MIAQLYREGRALILAEVLRDLLSQWIPIERQGPYGEREQRERLQAAARLVCGQCDGDLVEIGCLHGSTTVMLAEVAKEYNRHVIAIDPFETGTQNCDGSEMEIFCKNTEPYTDIVDFLRMRSDDPRAVEFVKARELAFAFVDGLHEYATCLRDIRTVNHATVIAVDDTLWSADVRRAYAEGAGTRTKIEIAEFRESWLI